jgi:hypothetical protein
MEDGKDKHTADDWQDFLETIRDGYRHLYSLERELNAIPDQARHSPEAKALLKEFTQAFADVMSREEFIEHCRTQGELVPNLKRPQGTA